MLVEKATKTHPGALVIKGIEPPASGSKIVYDAADGDPPDKVVRGFGLRITAGAAKSFILTYRTKAGRERRLTIGSWPDWNAAAAREHARELRRQINQGRDPLGERTADRAAPTVRDLAEKYVEKHLPKNRPSSRRNNAAMLRRWILPELGARKVAAVRPIDIEELHARVTASGSPIRANRVVALLSKMFSLGIRWEMRTDNPCHLAVERNPETKREVYLDLEQIATLSDALAAHPDQHVADAIRLLLLTGARRSEVLAARWDHIDFAAGMWRKSAAATSNKNRDTVPLSEAALELLARRRETIKGPFVFPGHGRPHLVEIKKSWAMLRSATGLEDVRIHDLRHSAASAMVSRGQTLPVIGKLLGHKSTATTARYAHLYTDPLRAAVNQLGRDVTGASKSAEPDPV